MNTTLDDFYHTWDYKCEDILGKDYLDNFFFKNKKVPFPTTPALDINLRHYYDLSHDASIIAWSNKNCDLTPQFWIDLITRPSYGKGFHHTIRLLWEAKDVSPQTVFSVLLAAWFKEIMDKHSPWDGWPTSLVRDNLAPIVHEAQNKVRQLSRGDWHPRHKNVLPDFIHFELVPKSKSCMESLI